MIGDKGIPKELYDVFSLFPPQVGTCHRSGSSPSVPEETKRWLSKSALTTAAVGLIAKFWLTCANSARVYGSLDTLYKTLEQRPPDTPLITVANHHSCMDEPLLWGILRTRHLTNNLLMRWVLAAHDICFTNRLHSSFFSYGKSIPTIRGDGVMQPGMNFALARLQEGHWLHLYPEGRVVETKEDIRLKWGVGRLISECRIPPIVIPIYHLGMDSILPNKTPYIPRVGQRVTVLVGQPIDLKDTLEELRKSNASAEDMRIVVTNLIQKQLYKLRINAEIFHAKHLCGSAP